MEQHSKRARCRRSSLLVPEWRVARFSLPLLRKPAQNLPSSATVKLNNLGSAPATGAALLLQELLSRARCSHSSSGLIAPRCASLFIYPWKTGACSMKKTKTNKHPTNVLAPEKPNSTGSSERISRMLNRIYAAHGGITHLSLEQWRQVEQELTARFQNAY